METVLVRKGRHVVSSDPSAILHAPSLGSTVAVCLRDRAKNIMGMAVVVLPAPLARGGETASFEALDAVSGLQCLFQDALAAGAERANLKVWLAGAAQFMEEPDEMALGVRIYKALRKILAKNKIDLAGEHVGGAVNRSVELDLGTGGPRIGLGGQKEVIL